MRIGLIAVDGANFPNIPLMKLSAYHKALGDHVEWYQPFSERYDLVYMSKVFSFTPDFDQCVNADRIVKGGTGYAIKLVNGREIFDKAQDVDLPYVVEHIYPDYSLYGITDTAYGFLTRGCPRGCGFCIVGNKEGLKSWRTAKLKEFWNGQKNIVLSDPNVLACAEWGEVLAELAESKASVDFNQGLDIRLINREKIEALNDVKLKEIRFAWDKYEDKELVLSKLEEFATYSKKKPHAGNTMVYTIVNFNTTFEQDVERIETLRKMGYWAYVMVYDKAHCDEKYRDLQRWVNMRSCFYACESFEDYKSAAALNRGGASGKSLYLSWKNGIINSWYCFKKVLKYEFEKYFKQVNRGGA